MSSVALIIPGKEGSKGPLALCNVGGLKLIERHIFALYYHGTKKVFILDPKNRLKDWKFKRKPQDIEVKTVKTIPSIESNFYLLRGDTVINKKFLDLASDFENSNKIEIFTGKPQDGKKMFTKSSGYDISLENSYYTGFSNVGSSHIPALSRALEVDSEYGDIKLIKNLSKTKSAEIIEGNNIFFHKVESKKDCFDAGTLLFHSLRKPQDGIIARTFNRPLSLPVSRVLSHLPLTPNQLSFINGLFAIAAAFFLAFGHSLLGMGFYLSGVLGGVFMQACSIYDGCDGEVARVKYQFTHFGDWLDTIIDDITNCLFFAGVATWAYFYTGQSRFIYMGIAAFIGQWTANIVMYYFLIKVTGTGNNQDYKVGFGDDEDGGLSGRIMDKLKYLTKRDFHLFMFFVISLFGRLDIGAYLIFVMASGAGIIFAAQHILMLKRGIPQKEKTE